MMAGRSKTDQLRTMGWKLSPVPRLIPAGPHSAAFVTTRGASEWLVNPPEGHPVAPRKVEGRNAAIRWAWAQATAPRPDPSLSGVASLAALASAAATSGTVVEGEDETGLAPARPDAELIALCRDVVAADGAVEEQRAQYPCPWSEKEAFKRQQARWRAAREERDQLLARISILPATTGAGVAAKAAALQPFLANRRGPQMAAVLKLLEEAVAVLGEGGAAPA
jgi:hypothetical protein